MYATPAEHLEAELAHLDLLLRRAVARFDREHATHQGIYITSDEVEALLGGAGHQPDEPDEPDGPDAGIAAARRRLDEAAGPDLPLPRLAARLGLTAAETQILVACLAPELDHRYDRIYAYLQDDLTRRRPSADLVTSLVADTRHRRWDALRLLGPHAPLLASGVLREVPDPASPSGSSALARLLQVAQPVVGHLLGHPSLDPLLADAGRLVPCPAAPRKPDERLTYLLRIAGERHDGGVVVQLHGAPGTGRADLARAVAHALGTAHVELSCPALPAAPAARADAVRAALRDAWLAGVPLLLLDADTLLAPGDGGTREQLLDPALTRFPGLVLLTTTQPWPPGTDPAGCQVHRVRLDPPGDGDRELLWRAALGPGRDGWAGLLAADVRLTPGQITGVAREVRDAALGAGHGDTPADWLAAARRRASHGLDGLARRVPPGRGWADLVLDADRTALLHEICDQARLRRTVLGDWGMAARTGVAQGLSVLFAGPPGTGKTLSAGVVAAELGLELFAIDLSQVVSKYIGETEKNLERVFTAAEDSGAVLLFDEADALFGTRTEIGDAHDRYANVETSYLLQRIEQYDGIAVLSTNLRQNLDEAFLRRLRFLVDFPLPDAAARRRIWDRHLSGGVPLSGVDLDLLADRMPVSGGSIRNIALAAAFLAAADGSAVTTSHLMWAARREFEKLGKLWRDPSTADGRTPPRNGRVVAEAAR